jgi:hypothetical protein
LRDGEKEVSMSLQAYEIEKRYKRFDVQIPHLCDFETRQDGSISNQELLKNLNISLYCLEPENQNLLLEKGNYTPVQG